MAKSKIMNEDNIRSTARILLGAGLIFAGIGHLSFARKEFQAQVPDFVPLKKDDTVVYSGVVEIAVGSALIVTPKKYRKQLGQLTAGLFAAVFPGNISQYVNQRDAFGLDTDKKRFLRLFFQPALILWALGSTDKNQISPD
jgi:uncharacterized membrane protein